MSLEPVPERYRRRRYWPALTMILVVLTVAGFIWLTALKPSASASTGCNAPGPAPATSSTAPAKTTAAKTTAAKTTAAKTTAAKTTAAKSTPVASTSLGTFVDDNTLANMRPADPSTIALQVYNASTVRGQAGTMTSSLRGAGFASIKAAADDPLYPAQDLHCVGEIRYGPAGAAAARTVLLMVPCAQLVNDHRLGDSVDLALGATYTYRPVSDAVTAELQQIIQAAAPPPVIEGQTEAAKPLPAIPPLPTCPNQS